MADELKPTDFVFMFGDDAAEGVCITTKEFWNQKFCISDEYHPDWEKVMPEHFECVAENQWHYFPTDWHIKRAKSGPVKEIRKILLGLGMIEVNWGDKTPV